MQQSYRILLTIAFLITVFFSGNLHADLSNNRVINHNMASRVEALKEKGGYSSEDFNACQITWATRALEKENSYSLFQPHEITFHYNNQEIVKLTNKQDGKAESIQKLGLHCLEFNEYVYLFFDTLNYETRIKFDLPDLAYAVYSSDQGATWSKMKSLHPLSTKAKFILPYDKFEQYVKLFGSASSHVLSIFNLRDETTYLFDAEFNTLKTVSVYNRLSSFDYPSDFYWHNNVLYLVRGSCEMVKKRLQCPSYAYMETSKDFGKSWKKQKLRFTKKSYFLTLDNSLYRFYSDSCRASWFGLIPAINRSKKCGYIKVEKLGENGKWEKAKIALKTASRLFGVYKDEKPILVWQDLRLHKSRPCGYIPVVGCIDSNPLRGPTVIYAGELDIETLRISESIISYKN